MNKLNHLLTLAERIATIAHKGQVDKAGMEYINHPRTVASMCNSTETKIIAWLHDVIEDSDVNYEDLKLMRFPDNIIEALRCLTKEDGYNLDEYYLRIKNNELAKKVKLADLIHNSDFARIPNDASDELKSMIKNKCKQYLMYKEYLLSSQDDETLSEFINNK